MNYIVVGMDNGANLRLAPSTTAGLVGNLKFATLLSETSPSSSKWKSVKVLDGPLAGKVGHVSSLNLDMVHSDGAIRLVQAAAYYWEKFDRGKGKEGDDGSSNSKGTNYKKMVLEMWDALNGGRPPNNNTSHPNWPWSAAGMSAFVRKAGEGGGYGSFRYSGGHHAFIKHSVRMREESNAAGPFLGLRLSEHRPKVGDLVVRWRGGVRTYEAVKAIMKTSTTFASHTDVICEIKAGYLWALGANNSNSVSRRKYLLDGNGFVKLTGDCFMIMKNVVP